MSAEDSLSNRMIAIETHLLHLEFDLDQLNNVIIAQQAEIDCLKCVVRDLESQLDTAAEDSMPADPTPPHY